jgi:hypothetical protein
MRRKLASLHARIAALIEANGPNNCTIALE